MLRDAAAISKNLIENGILCLAHPGRIHSCSTQHPEAFSKVVPRFNLALRVPSGEVRIRVSVVLGGEHIFKLVLGESNHVGNTQAPRKNRREVSDEPLFFGVTQLISLGLALVDVDGVRGVAVIGAAFIVLRGGEAESQTRDALELPVDAPPVRFGMGAQTRSGCCMRQVRKRAEAPIKGLCRCQQGFLHISHQLVARA